MKKVEPLTAEFFRAADQLAARLTDSGERPTAALAADLPPPGRRNAAGALRQRRSVAVGSLAEHRGLGGEPLARRRRLALAELPGDAFRFRRSDAGISAARVARGTQGVCRGEGRLSRSRRRRSPGKVRRRHGPLCQSPPHPGREDRAVAAKLPIQHRDQELLDATAYPLPGSTDVEVFYNRLDPFFWSWVASLAAVLCLLLAVGRVQRPMFWLGVAVLVAAQTCTAAGLALRWYITGLVPLTGMFETVVFVALYAGLLGLWFTLKPLLYRRSRHTPCAVADGTRSVPDTADGTRSVPNTMEDVFQRRLFVVAGASVSFIAAVLAYYAPSSVMHRNIGAAMPILRDNFWLAVHVVTIMASYASAAIAPILGNVALGYYLFGRYGTPHTPCAEDGTISWGGSCTAAPDSASGTGVQLPSQRIGTRRVPDTTRRPPEASRSWRASSTRQSKSPCCC